jgi:hypothetical protein
MRWAGHVARMGRKVMHMITVEVEVEVNLRPTVSRPGSGSGLHYD